MGQLTDNDNRVVVAYHNRRTPREKKERDKTKTSDITIMKPSSNKTYIVIYTKRIRERRMEQINDCKNKRLIYR